MMRMELNFPNWIRCQFFGDLWSGCCCLVSRFVKWCEAFCPNCLSLAATFYTAAKALLGYVGIPMHTVPPHSAAGPHTVDGNIESYRSNSIQPTLDGRLSVNLGRKSTAKEIIIMAAIVVIAKMRYGLDGEERWAFLHFSRWIRRLLTYSWQTWESRWSSAVEWSTTFGRMASFVEVTGRTPAKWPPSSVRSARVSLMRGTFSCQHATNLSSR